MDGGFDNIIWVLTKYINIPGNISLILLMMYYYNNLQCERNTILCIGTQHSMIVYIVYQLLRLLALKPIF